MPEQDTKVRIPVDLHEQVKHATITRKTTLKQAIIDGLKLWIDGPVAAKPEPLPKQFAYRPENKAWHDRLELVLNDPDEALGIQKNLEWAEKTVLGKRSTARRTASG